MITCKHFHTEVCARWGRVLHTFEQLSGHFDLQHSMLDAHLLIHLTHNDSRYICKVKLSNNGSLDLSESFAIGQNLWIHSAFYNVMFSFAKILSYGRLSPFAIFYLPTQFERSILIHHAYAMVYFLYKFLMFFFYLKCLF